MFLIGYDAELVREALEWSVIRGGRSGRVGVARMALSDLQSFIGRKYAYQDPSRFARMTVIVAMVDR
ncbi:MAG: hypothetical protein HC788_14920 [Sphingopyxis sp.]|nr:hypothetical protein [Sphingopyxis sp.]